MCDLTIAISLLPLIYMYISKIVLQTLVYAASFPTDMDRLWLIFWYSNIFICPSCVLAIIWFSKTAVVFVIWRLYCSRKIHLMQPFLHFFHIIIIYSFQKSCCSFLYVLYIFCQGGKNLWAIKRVYEGVILTSSVFGRYLTFMSLIRSAARAESIN